MKIILIKSKGITRELPFIDGKGDFSGITEPTLAILKEACDNGNYEIKEIEEEINIVVG